MNTVTFEQVESLFGRQPGWCVSLYLPTHRSGPDIRKDPIRLKNRISEAEAQLEAAGVDEEEIKGLTSKARRLCDLDSEGNRQFWQHQADGLAMFLSADGQEHYRLPQRFDEVTVVARRYHIKPLLQALQGDGEYYLLAVSQNRVRFLEGSRSGLAERPVEDLPESLRDLVGSDREKGFNLGSFRTRANAGHDAVPHGHVETNEEHERNRFFREIAEAIDDHLREEKLPLVFAGVEDLFPYFKEATGYAHLVEQPLTGNPDHSSEDELHEGAWPLVEEVLRQRRRKHLDRWQEVSHSDLGDDSPQKILLAATDGRVDTLFLATDRQLWGTFDEESRVVEIEEESTAENYDLLDLAAVKTLLTGGEVILIEDSERLTRTGVAAIYRYSIS